jgi:hypothetical protein
MIYTHSKGLGSANAIIKTALLSHARFGYMFALRTMLNTYDWARFTDSASTLIFTLRATTGPAAWGNLLRRPREWAWKRVWRAKI